MTDARLKGEWLTAPVHDGLSDAAYRIFHNALMHSAEQGTDGLITTRELRFLYPGRIDPAWLDELASAGIWEATGDGYQLIGWSDVLGQSTAAEVEAYRAGNRERQRRRRERQRAASNDRARGDSSFTGPEAASPPQATRDLTGGVTRDSSRDLPHDVGKARTGTARPSPSSPDGLIDGYEVGRSSPVVTAREPVESPVTARAVDKPEGGRFDIAAFRAQRPDLRYLDDPTVNTLAQRTLGRAKGTVRNETAYVLRAADEEWVKAGVDLQYSQLVGGEDR